MKPSSGCVLLRTRRSFCDYLTLYHPNGPTEYVNLTGPMPARIRPYLRTDYDRDTYPVPYDPDHLFACGVTGNGVPARGRVPADIRQAWEDAHNH
ncbi:hypothetical protein [Streptomyces niveus]|uniref:hypothetical protein n=1 Tax=Streptomyces niveus TaxID=193462 RepID=UPI00364E4624